MKIETVLAVSGQRDRNPALTKLAHLLAEANITLEVKDTLEDAAAGLLLGDNVHATCVLVDVAHVDDYGHLRDALPQAAPVAFSAGATAEQVISAMRSGVYDFVDFAIDSDATVLSALEAALRESRRRMAQRKRVSAMRTVVEDFLRVLVKAERRSIDLEEKLRQSGSYPAVVDEAAAPEPEPDPDRSPCVLVVDDDSDVLDLLTDVLGRDGLRTRSAARGEDAIEAVADSVDAGEPIDLLLVDKNLPDVDGIRVIGRCLDIEPTLAAMVMTGFASTESAIDAADLGVVGYVLKPFDDVPSLVRRVREVAARSLHDRRERRYLERIKQRHSEFLLRYRQLAAQFDKLS